MVAGHRPATLLILQSMRTRTPHRVSLQSTRAWLVRGGWQLSLHTFAIPPPNSNNYNLTLATVTEKVLSKPTWGEMESMAISHHHLHRAIRHRRRQPGINTWLLPEVRLEEATNQSWDPSRDPVHLSRNWNPLPSIPIESRSQSGCMCVCFFLGGGGASVMRSWSRSKKSIERGSYMWSPRTTYNPSGTSSIGSSVEYTRSIDSDRIIFVVWSKPFKSP